MRFWIGTCVILAPTIILPAAMSGGAGTITKFKLTEEQKTIYKSAYEQDHYFTCGENKSKEQDTGCKNEEIIKKAIQKLNTGGNKSKEK